MARADCPLWLFRRLRCICGGRAAGGVECGVGVCDSLFPRVDVADLHWSGHVRLAGGGGRRLSMASSPGRYGGGGLVGGDLCRGDFWGGVGDVVSRTFYAQHDTLTPVDCECGGICFGGWSEGGAGWFGGCDGVGGGDFAVLFSECERAARGARVAVVGGDVGGSGVCGGARAVLVGDCVVAALVVRLPTVWAVLPAVRPVPWRCISLCCG